MRPVIKGISAFGLGAGTMYFFDPRLGPRRRAYVRDKTLHYAKAGAHGLACFANDVLNHTRGWYYEARARLKERPVADDVLIRRVRSKIGRAVTHSHCIVVTAKDHTITLSGPILAAEVPGLLRTVMLVRGVRAVDNRLELHADSSNIPALQGGRHLRKAV